MSSMPTDSRTRSSGTSSCDPAVEACVIAPGCSISDSTPPSDSARMKISVREQKSRAACGPPAQPDRHHAAEAAHLPGGDVVVGMVGQARDTAPCSIAGCSARNSATAAALSLCRCIRSGRVLSPRIVR